MEVKELILKGLKTKCASFGFNESELKSVAETLSNNLSEEDAKDEEKINAQIEAVIPFLKVGQQQANRIVTQSKKNDDEAKKKAEEDAKKKAEEEKAKKHADEEPEYFKKYREMMEGRLKQLEDEKISNSRKTKLESLLKDSGIFGERAMKTFSRMSFKDDDDFESFLEDTKKDLETYTKDKSQASLHINPLSLSVDGKKVATTDEIKAIANV